MNWLAHVLLSENSIDFQVGNFIADPLKAKAWENASDDLKKGMQVHKIIDSYTDKHQAFESSKKRLKQKGLLKAIIVDFTYDYLLSKNWDSFCNRPLDEFMKDFYTKANNQKALYPNFAQVIVANMIKRDLLNYKEQNSLEIAFKRLDMRLSPRLARRDSAISYYEIVLLQLKYLEDDFMEFFPDLIKEVKKNTNNSKLNHLKI